MDDVRRVFQQVVHVLAEREPDRLYRPLPVTELHDTILPYRRYRRELRFDAIEDYEMAVLRFLAGEGGYATVEPEEVRLRLAREADAVNPSTGVIRGFVDATVTLNPETVTAVLQARRAYAPPEPEPALPAVDRPDLSGGQLDGEIPTDVSRPADAPPTDVETQNDASPPPPPASAHPPRAAIPSCSQCGTAFPVWRAISFCPHCGIRLPHTECQRCGERLEEGWRHCVACGERTTP